MSQIPTATYFLVNHIEHSIPDLMRAFAQRHVAAALKAAAQQAGLRPTNEYLGNDHYANEVDIDSILEAYPISNIK